AVVYHSKKLDSAGSVESTPSERYFSAEAALLLARKWGATDVLRSLIEVMEDSSNDDHRDAIARYRQLESLGRLPDVVPQGGKVAEFVNGAYGKTRW
ncbi:MAG: hypothetical protein ACYC6C_12575, partial [Coriobacteriia bacterium]